MPDDWKNETMADLRTDSPYYWEMKETEAEHRRWIAEVEADERAEMMAEVDYEDSEDDEYDDPFAPEHW